MRLRGDFQDELNALDERVTRLEERVNALATTSSTNAAAMLVQRLDALEARVDALSSSTAENGNRIMVVERAVSSLEDSFIREDLELAVPSTEFSNLAEALASIASKRIYADAKVVIRLSGTTTLGRLDITHPDADRIQIVGDVDDPSQVVVNLTGNVGIAVSSGRTLGYLAGFTLQPDGAGPPPQYGIKVEDGAFARVGVMHIRNFNESTRACVWVDNGGVLTYSRNYENWSAGDSARFRLSDCQRGIEARLGSVASVDTDLVVQNVGRYGVLARAGAAISADRSTFTTTVRPAGAEGGAVFALEGSVILAGNAQSSGHDPLAGFAAYYHSIVQANNATSTNDQAGFTAWHGSTVSARQGTVTNAAGGAYYAAYGSYIYAEDSNSVDATPFAYWSRNSSYIYAIRANATGTMTAFDPGDFCESLSRVECDQTDAYVAVPR